MSVVVPRPSASLLVVADDPFRVLMVRRRAGGSFSSARVFPGGVVEPGDGDPRETDSAARAAAIRETWEETGVLIGTDRPVASLAGRALPVDALVPFGHWITPEAYPRRWDTRFYLCAMPPGQHPRADGGEVAAVEWLALADADLAAPDLPFPTRMNLARLAESDGVAAALAAARARPVVTVLPIVTRDGTHRVSTIPAAAGYPVTELRDELPPG